MEQAGQTYIRYMMRLEETSQIELSRLICIGVCASGLAPSFEIRGKELGALGHIMSLSHPFVAIHFLKGVAYKCKLVRHSTWHGRFDFCWLLNDPHQQTPCHVQQRMAAKQASPRLQSYDMSPVFPMRLA